MTTEVATVLVAVLPGAVLALCVPAGRERWAALAAAPVLSLALTTLALAWLPVLRLPDGVLDVLLAEAVVVAVAVAATLVHRRRSGLPLLRGEEAPGPRSRRPLRAALAELVAVGLPTAVGVVFGRLVLGGFVATPGWDGMNHAYMTRRMLEAGHAQITTACSTGSTVPVTSCAFYPISPDVSWAQAVALTGGHVSAAMTTWAALLSPVSLVVGVYAATRLLGARRVAAMAAGTAAALVGPLWAIMLSGRVSEQMGPALSPATALLVALALRGRRPVTTGLLAGLACAGMLMTHTYQALFVAVLAVAMALAVRADWRWTASVRGSLAILAGMAVAALPLTGALLAASGERLSLAPAYVGKPWQALRYWTWEPMLYTSLGYPYPTGDRYPLDQWAARLAMAAVILCLAAAPASLVLRRLRWARPWVLAWLVFTAVGVWTSTSASPLAVGLSGLWYGTRERLRAMMFPAYGVAAAAGACVLGWLLARLVRLVLRRTPGPGRLVEAVVPAALACTLVGAAALPAAWQPLREDLLRRAPQGPEYRRVYQWLAEHTAPGNVVAYDRHTDFMTWSYGDEAVPTLFGIPPLAGKAAKQNYADRYAAFHWLADDKDARPAGCLVRRYRIQYIAVGTPKVPGIKRTYSPTRLRQSDRVRLVHRDGPLEVYEVTARGAACRS